MNTRRALSTLAVCAALLPSLGGPLATSAAPDSVEVGSLAPALECEDAAGDLVEWADFGEKAVILHFHSSSVSNSGRALAGLASTIGADPALGKQVAIVVVGAAADEPEIEAALRSAGCEIRVARAPDRGPNQRYGVIAYPTAFVLDGEHKVVEIMRGYGALFAWRTTLAARLASGQINVEEYDRMRAGDGATGSQSTDRSTRTLQLVRRLIASDKLDLARATLAQAAELESEPGPLSRLFVRLLLAEGEFEEAAGWIERQIAAHPRDPGLMAARARVTAAAGDHVAAEKILAPLDPAIPEVLLARGAIAESKSQWRDAASLYREALERMLLLSD